jgi:choline kinase
LQGKSLLDWQIEAAREVGIEDIIVVGGYRADQLLRAGIQVVRNPWFETTNMVTSLFCAQEMFGDGFVLSYGDIVYTPRILQTLIDDGSSVGVVVDRDWLSYWLMRFADPLSDAESLRMTPEGNLLSVGQLERNIGLIEAQYIGLMSFRGEGLVGLNRAHLAAQSAECRGALPFGGTRPLSGLFMTDLLQGMIDNGTPLHAVQVSGGWVEIDNIDDLHLAESLVRSGRLSSESG